MKNTKHIEKYIFDFFSSFYKDFESYYLSVYENRKTEIYTLTKGSELLDFIRGIHYRIEKDYLKENIVPQVFVTPEALFNALNEFKDYLNSYQEYIDFNKSKFNEHYYLKELQDFKERIIKLIDYTRVSYENEGTNIPYQDLRKSLISQNIELFILTLKSVLASVSYEISKVKEGYFHSNIHLILKLLGFEIISEDSTNNGRIDAVIKIWDYIYIIEFKFHENKDLSSHALQQIKEKEYASKYFVEKKKIIGIGISFSQELRNINGYKYESL